MIPTLVLVYDNSLQLKSISSQVISRELMRVVHLDSKVGISLYSNSNSTPFVEGAMIFDEIGNKVAIRRDKYDDLLDLVEKTYHNTSANNKRLLKEWYNEKKISLEELYRKVPDIL